MENNGFKYTYSAPTEQERREITSIRQQYVSEESGGGKLARLRYLDSRVRNIPTAVSLVFGVVGLLIFGLGLTCVLEFSKITLGIILAAVGVVPIAIAYPIHSALSRHYRKKHGDEIIKLSDELLGEGDAD